MSREPRRILLTHYDLDGVGCDIIMSKLYSFDKKYKAGYAKIKQYILDGNMGGYDTAVVTDISLEYGQFKQLQEEYGKKFLYIDHHAPSVDMVNRLEGNESLTYVNKNFAATAIAFQLFAKKLMADNPGIMDFVTSVDAYDCWRHVQRPVQFEMGYNLNTLFWKYGYNNFYTRFFKDFSMNYSDTEKKWISDNAKARDKAMIESDKNPFGKNALLVLDAPREYINDYGLQFPEYDTFYLLYPKIKGGLSLSVRTTRKDINVGDCLKAVGNWNPYVTTAGGHPEAGGMDFNDDADINVILDIVEAVNNEMEGIVPDVPF